jgi:hypothetical protein
MIHVKITVTSDTTVISDTNDASDANVTILIKKHIQKCHSEREQASFRTKRCHSECRSVILSRSEESRGPAREILRCGSE